MNTIPLQISRSKAGIGTDLTWLASPTQWKRIQANSEKQWRIEELGVLQPMGLQRAGHDSATEEQQHGQTVEYKFTLNQSTAFPKIEDMKEIRLVDK